MFLISTSHAGGQLHAPVALPRGKKQSGGLLGRSKKKMRLTARQHTHDLHTECCFTDHCAGVGVQGTETQDPLSLFSFQVKYVTFTM